MRRVTRGGVGFGHLSSICHQPRFWDFRFLVGGSKKKRAVHTTSALTGRRENEAPSQTTHPTGVRYKQDESVYLLTNTRCLQVERQSRSFHRASSSTACFSQHVHHDTLRSPAGPFRFVWLGWCFESLELDELALSMTGRTLVLGDAHPLPDTASFPV